MRHPVAKARHDDVIGDAIGVEIRDGTLETAPHFQTYRAVLQGDDEDGAIIDALAPRQPLARETNAVLLDLFRRRGLNHQHRQLRALALLQIFEACRQLSTASLGQGTREIDDIAGERR